MTRVLTPSTDQTVRQIIHHERAVGWFDLRQLVSTAAKTVASTVIGSMSGRREQMAALDPLPSDDALAHAYGQQDEIWLDYVADTGDGWDATYTVAYLVGRDGIVLESNGAATEQGTLAADTTITLPAGQILVFGGDEVYPTASSEQYQARLVDPYYCARPWDRAGRDLFVVPGNHDWYDGLTSFIRLFCQNQQDRWIGAWLPQQRRSYFAVRLPHRWWLWGIDLALEDDLDPPQYDYFARHAGLLTNSDKVILCIPEPLWVSAEPPDTMGKRSSKLWNKLKLIEDLVIESGAAIPVWLAGDLHHYARYESIDGGSRQYITCGGGGAFLLGTHGQPQRLELPCGTPAEHRHAFPDSRQSQRMGWGALLFSWRSKGFTGALLGVQLVLFWLVYLASSDTAAISANLGWWTSLLRSPAGLVVAFAALAGFIGFAKSGSKPSTIPYLWIGAGVVHAIVQMGGTQFALWSILTLSGPLMPVWIVLGSVGLYVLIGLVFGSYLLASERLFGLHRQEVFSCQALADWKCFLRMQITEEALTIYPIGVERICRSWKIAADVVKKGSWHRWDMVQAEVLDVPMDAERVFDPAEPLRPQLIEPPIVIRTPRRAGTQGLTMAKETVVPAGPER